jgi:hypothetical protein
VHLIVVHSVHRAVLLALRGELPERKQITGNLIIWILDIIHLPVFYLKQHVAETGFRLQVEPPELGPIDIASQYL